MKYKLPDEIIAQCKAGTPVFYDWYNFTKDFILTTIYLLVKQKYAKMYDNLNMGLNKLICNRLINYQPTPTNALLGRDLPQVLTNYHPQMQLEIDERYATQHR